MFAVYCSENVVRDLHHLRDIDAKAFERAERVFRELMTEPLSREGHPEAVPNAPNHWMRRISRNHRVLFQMFPTKVHVHAVFTMSRRIAYPQV